MSQGPRRGWVATSQLSHVGGRRLEGGKDQESKKLQGTEANLAALDLEGGLAEAAFEGSHTGEFGGGYG